MRCAVVNHCDLVQRQSAHNSQPEGNRYLNMIEHSHVKPLERGGRGTCDPVPPYCWPNYALLADIDEDVVLKVALSWPPSPCMAAIAATAINAAIRPYSMAVAPV